MGKLHDTYTINTHMDNVTVIDFKSKGFKCWLFELSIKLLIIFSIDNFVYKMPENGDQRYAAM